MDPQLLAACVIAAALHYRDDDRHEGRTIPDEAFELYDAVMWRVNERNRKADKRAAG